MKVVRLALVALAGALAGCATFDRGTTDKIYLLSEPPGARASASFGATCTTPCSFDASRRDEFTVAFEKPGHATRRVAVKTRLTGVGVGDLMEDVATAGVGMVVDAGTGATLEHIPNPVSVTLSKTEARLR